MRSDYFPTHAHSEFSVLDGMGSVEAMVQRVADLGQPGLALTDHGTMAGVLRLYKECAKHGIAAFPGSELYVVTDVNDKLAKEQRFHMGMMALTYDGFVAMNRLSSRSFTRERFHRKPLIDFGDLAEFSHPADVAVTTGCFFGIVQQAYVRQGYKQALQMTQMLAKWFPHTYVELQHHGIVEEDHDDDEMVEVLMSIADETGLPIVFGQDSHYCDAEHQPAHDLMKSICYFGDVDDYQFPGGPFHLIDTPTLHKLWTPKEWARIEEGHSDLLDLNRMTLPALDSYRFMVPEIASKPDAKLAKLVNQSTRLEEDRISTADWVGYKKQLKHELAVIKHHGFADYFLLVREICIWMRQNGIVFNIRGSANGSLVNYVTGITEVDPIMWNTRFDRFLSYERKKPPDVDIDIASGRREEVIGYVRSRFPSMVAIGTYGRMGITESEDDFGGEDKGSVFVQYMAAMRRKQGPDFNGKVDPSHRQPLNELADLPVRRSLGTHAGGYVLPTAGMPIDAYLATALVPSSNTTVTQAVMEDVEDCGYVKLDLLGLRALETLNTTLENLGHAQMDFSWIPWDDKKACALLRSGFKTAGIFQFEGHSTAKGGREMQVKNTLDAIICLALYRPALMNGGQKDLYLGNRGKPKEERPYKLHEFFDPILEDTSGVTVFQEQVMEICQAIGMPFDAWNDLMKAVKASNDKIDEYAVGIMERVEPIFHKCCDEQGIDHGSAIDVWDAILGFTDYGFNRAHATSYGQMAYRSAYLKAHHPLEYMHGLLSAWAGVAEKERVYMKAARELKIQIGRPNINQSNITWAIDKSKEMTLRKGFTTIKGIGVTVAEEIVMARPEDGWKTMDEFVEAVPSKVSGGKMWKESGGKELNGSMAKLRDAAALTVIGLEPGD